MDGDFQAVDTPFAVQSLRVGAGSFYYIAYGGNGLEQPVYSGTIVTVGQSQLISSAQCMSELGYGE